MGQFAPCPISERTENSLVGYFPLEKGPEKKKKISFCPGLLEPGHLVPGFAFNEKFCWLTICVQSNEEQSQLKIIGALCYCL